MRKRLVDTLAKRNLRSDRFATLCAIIGVALGTATVNVVLTLDENTRAAESRRWSTNPDLKIDLSRTVALVGYTKDGKRVTPEDAKEETHEDYQVMRSAIRLGSLSAYLVGALIVFFTFRVVVEQRRREIALLRSLGSTSRQVASIFLLEALIIGVLGAVIGFILAPPMSVMAAFAGITTTGRARIWWLYFPWSKMMLVSSIGALTAILGVLRPLREVLKLEVPQTLRPQFIDSEKSVARRQRGVTIIALPFMALLYVLIRPFFFEVLPSLAFFVLEAGLVCAGFLGMLVLVPQLVSVVGGQVSKLLPSTERAAKLLTTRRIERAGHEFAWSVSGVMLVFALLLSLHIITLSLKQEVVAWAGRAIAGNAYVYTYKSSYLVPKRLVRSLPKDALTLPYSGRSPWPNAILATDRKALIAFAQATSPQAEALAKKLQPGKILLSTMMARREGLGVGDFLEVKSRSRTARLQVAAVTDEIGYMPMVGPYRNSKTYGLISEADVDLIAQYAGPIGSSLAFRDPHGRTSAQVWANRLDPAKRARGVRLEVGTQFEAERVRETNRDFAIFDLILFLTALLAAVGIANNLVLSSHIRRREISLYQVLGMTGPQIRKLFIMEGLFIGALGGLMASVLGVPLGFAGIGALKVISAFDVGFHFPLSYVLYTIIGATLISLAASLYPAAHASKLSGAESIHYE